MSDRSTVTVSSTALAFRQTALPGNPGRGMSDMSPGMSQASDNEPTSDVTIAPKIDPAIHQGRPAIRLHVLVTGFRFP
jgi:hypothetical protein